MILTITLNPSMDYVYRRDTFVLGEHNRFENPHKMPGGKGINAARAISFLGGDVICFTALAGLNGEHIKKMLDSEKFTYINHEINGESRNAITVMHDGAKQTEIVEAGPELSTKEEKEIFDQIDLILNNNSYKVVTINGSVNSRNDSLYLNLLKKIKNEHPDIFLLMDVSGQQLKNIVNSKDIHPYFIKPNIVEFSELVNEEFADKDELIHFLKTFNTNINLLLISCGEHGAVVKYKDNIYNVEIPKVKVVNPTGSGDSTVAGVAYAIDNDYDFESMIKLAMASGMSNAMEKGVGVVNKEVVSELIKKISVDLIV